MCLHRVAMDQVQQFADDTVWFTVHTHSRHCMQCTGRNRPHGAPVNIIMAMYLYCKQTPLQK